MSLVRINTRHKSRHVDSGAISGSTPTRSFLYRTKLPSGFILEVEKDACDGGLCPLRAVETG